MWEGPQKLLQSHRSACFEVKGSFNICQKQHFKIMPEKNKIMPEKNKIMPGNHFYCKNTQCLKFKAFKKYEFISSCVKTIIFFRF